MKSISISNSSQEIPISTILMTKGAGSYADADFESDRDLDYRTVPWSHSDEEISARRNVDDEKYAATTRKGSNDEKKRQRR